MEKGSIGLYRCGTELSEVSALVGVTSVQTADRSAAPEKEKPLNNMLLLLPLFASSISTFLSV